MEITSERFRRCDLVKAVGRIDSQTAPQLAEAFRAITEDGRFKIVFDMSGVGFIDSQGLEQLLWARDHCNENKQGIRLAGLDENCKTILEITRLENEFDRYAELSEAVRSFA